MTPTRTLGRYTLKRRLASGGMGEVYLAEVLGAANFSRRVAIKRILPHLARDESFVAKFIDEANLLTRLHHGNIVGVMELADADGELYLVMDYLPGRDLKAVLRRLLQLDRRMPAELAVWLATEILAGLDYAHRMVDDAGRPLHIVHRDVSPANVCLGAGGEVKLIDFGIAKARGGLHQSVAGTLQGKFIYMSPEQADGRELDPRSDVFAVGLLLYELLTGVRPFEAESEPAVLRKVREAHVAAPSTLVANLDGDLESLLMRALAREPAGRFSSAGDMRRALLHHLADRRSDADAAALASFLTVLFPEGVVPNDEPDEPWSFDDALQAQLDGLTPSAARRRRPGTDTRSGPESRSLDTPSGKGATATRSLADGSPSGGFPPAGSGGFPRAEGSGGFPPVRTGSVTGRRGADEHNTPTTPPAPESRSTRRWLVLAALVLGAGAAALALASTRQAEATVEVLTEPASIPGMRVLVGTELSLLVAGARLPARTVQMCVEGEGFLRACQYVPLQPGLNRPLFNLVAVPELVVELSPPEARATVRINDLPVSQFPYRDLAEGRTARVVVTPGSGWEVDGDPTEVIRVRNGRNLLHFALLRSPDAEDDGPEDAGVSEDAGTEDAETQPKAGNRPPRRATVILESVPPAEGVCTDGTRGPSPLTVTAIRGPVRCTFTADDHAPRTEPVLPTDASRRRTVTLERLAHLTARAEPGAAEILINGKALKQNPLLDHALPAGTWRLQARLRLPEGERLSPTRTVTLRAGERLDEAILLRVDPTQAGDSP